MTDSIVTIILRLNKLFKNTKKAFRVLKAFSLIEGWILYQNKTK